MDIGVSDKDRTKNVHLNLTNLFDRIYVDDKLWISTIFDEIKIGVIGGPVYKLSKKKLIEYGVDSKE